MESVPCRSSLVDPARPKLMALDVRETFACGCDADCGAVAETDVCEDSDRLKLRSKSTSKSFFMARFHLIPGTALSLGKLVQANSRDKWTQVVCIRSARPIGGVETGIRKTVLSNHPKWLSRRHKLHRNRRNECLQPACALFHSGLFAGDVTDHDQRLLTAFGHSVGRVFDRLPFARFAHEQYLYVTLLEQMRFVFEAGGAGR